MAIWEASYGSLNHIGVKGSADFALIPGTLSARISGVTNKRDGYLTRLDYGCLHPGSGVPAMTTNVDCKLGTEGGRNIQAGRLALRWSANEDLEVNLIGTLSSESSEVGATKLLDITTHSNIPAGIDPRAFLTGPESRTSYATYTSPAFTDPTAYLRATGAGTHGTVSVNPQTEVRGRDVSAKIDWTLGGGVDLDVHHRLPGLLGQPRLRH